MWIATAQSVERLTAGREVEVRVAWMITKNGGKNNVLNLYFRANYMHTECRNVWFEISRKMTPPYPPHI